jgi:adenylylsulfate kinase
MQTIPNIQNVRWHSPAVTREQRQVLNGHRSPVIWFTGLSGSGKSTLANAVEARLHAVGCRTFVLDGDNVRYGLCSDLDFSVAGRTENIRRVGEMAKLFANAGVITLTAFISPFQVDRLKVRQLLDPLDFIEVYCNCPLEVCENRDVKGLYRKARADEIPEFTGISSPYEIPTAPDLIVDTGQTHIDTCVTQVIELLHARGVLARE